MIIRIIATHSVHPPLSAGRVNLHQNLKKGGGLTRPKLLEVRFWERWGGGGSQKSIQRWGVLDSLQI